MAWIEIQTSTSVLLWLTAVTTILMVNGVNAKYQQSSNSTSNSPTMPITTTTSSTSKATTTATTTTGSILRDDPYAQIVTSGLTSILWEESNHFAKQLSSLNPPCAAALTHIHKGLRSGWSKAYELLDYSSKVPSGILDGTTVALGDYDACLALTLDDGHGVGQYCSVTMALTHPGNSSSIGQLYYSTLPYLGAFDLTFGLCLPSVCSVDDVTKFVTLRTQNHPLELSVYRPFPLDFDTPITCDTLERNSWRYRLTHLSWLQITSIIWISILPALVTLSTLLDLIGMNHKWNCLSIRQSVKSLISYEEPTDYVNFLIESAKACIVIGGFLGHFILPVEKLQQIRYISSPNIYVDFTGNWIAQPWNDGLLGVFPFAAGYACYKFYWNRINSGTFNYIRCIFTRYIRVILASSIAIAAEFLYPLVGDGPAFTPMAQRVINDCELNWWKHFVLDGHTQTTRSCAIHMFLGSIDMRLLLVGFAILLSFKKFGPKLTLGACFALMIASCISLHESVKHLQLPTFFSNPCDLRLISESFYTTHFLVSYYLPGYLLGMVTAYWIENDIRFYEPSILIWLSHLALFYGWCIFGMFAPGLHTVLNVVPRSLYGLFIVGHRMTYFIAFSMFSLLLSHSEGWVTPFTVVPKLYRRVFVYSAKLAPSVHLVNLLYIRFHFTTSRQLISIRPYDLILRWSFGGWIVLILSAFTHVFLIAPLLALSPKSKSSSEVGGAGNGKKVNGNKDIFGRGTFFLLLTSTSKDNDRCTTRSVMRMTT